VMLMQVFAGHGCGPPGDRPAALEEQRFLDLASYAALPLRRRLARAAAGQKAHGSIACFIFGGGEADPSERAVSGLTCLDPVLFLFGRITS